MFRNMIELETLIMVLRQLAFFPFFPSFFFHSSYDVFVYDVYDVSVFDGNDRSEKNTSKDFFFLKQPKKERKHLKKRNQSDRNPKNIITKRNYDSNPVVLERCHT